MTIPLPPRSRFPGSPSRRALAWLPALVLAALAPGLAQAQDTIPRGHWNMTQGVTDISHRVYDLHMIVFAVVTIIGIGVFGVMIYSLINHRRSKHPRAADFHESVLIEIVWTTLPFLVLIGLAIPAAGLLLRMEDTRNAEMVIQATGYQWKWQYEYFSADNKPYNVSFFSTLAQDQNEARQLGQNRRIDQLPPHYLWDVDNPLVIPTGTKIKVRVTAADVIHAWWVPDLAIKKDAIPGYINEVWTKVDRPGVYRGVCAELCGRDHGAMPIVVKAVSPAEFRQFIASKGGQVVPNGAPVAAAVNAPLASAAPANDVSLGPAAGAVAGGPTGTINVPGTKATTAPATTAAATPAPASGAALPAAGSGGAAGGAMAKATATTEPVAPKKMSHAELMATGQKVYTQCAACHQPTGAGLPPTFPSLIGDAVVRGPIQAHITQVLKGKNAMPPFAQLSDAEIASVITFERNSWGNASGDVQPADVAKVRAGG